MGKKKALLLVERNVAKMAVGDTLRDDKVTGFMLRALATKKVFYYYYRTKAGRERKPSIGRYGELTIVQARDIAKSYAAEVAKGNDPSEETAGSRRAPTVKQLWEKYYTEHCVKNLTPTTLDSNIYVWTKYILPQLGHRKVADLTYDDCYNLHNKITKMGHPHQANRCHSSLSNALRSAELKWRWIDRNPARGVKQNPEEERNIVIEPFHLIALAKALDDFEWKYPFVVKFVRVLLFTGGRKSEWLHAKREWLHVYGDGSGAILQIPGVKKGTKKAKDKRIFVPTEALDVLNSLPNINEYFFPSTRCKGIEARPLRSPDKAWGKIRKSQPVLMDIGEYGALRLHDLRHVYATYGTMVVNEDHIKIGKLLGHKRANTTRRYVGLLKNAGQDIANETAATIAANMRGEASSF